jgi:hypothetical protein
VNRDRYNRQCHFRDIVVHKGPLYPTNKYYKGFRFNVLVNWKTGGSTYKPLDVMHATNPITCAAYAKQQGLLDTPGWKHFKRLAVRNIMFQWLAHQAWLHTSWRTPVLKIVYQLPHDHKVLHSTTNVCTKNRRNAVSTMPGKRKVGVSKQPAIFLRFNIKIRL